MAPILIVDAEPDDRILALLEQEGLEVRTARSSGDVAMAIDAPVAVAIVDTGNGAAVCRDILRRYPKCLILAFSSRDDEDLRIESLDAGADAFVPKSVGTLELRARLRTLLRRSHSLQVADQTAE